VKVAINLSFAANLSLAVLQLYAAISSGSLALLATAVDAGGLMGALVDMTRTDWHSL
jgi:divalent metal cation (Fe/Co/Zn/Cd) transporter